VKIICIGDSVTYGQGVRADEAWPAVLAELTGHDVRNEGVCGDTSRLGLERFPNAVQMHRPDVVVVQFGHNDANIWETDNGLPRVSKDAYVANVVEMVARTAVLDRARAVVLLPHLAKRDAGDRYNERLGNYTNRLRPLIYCPLEPPPVSFVQDGYGLHPDPTMHAKIAARVAARIRML
jgi:lysophospholipase L1-like esterase